MSQGYRRQSVTWSKDGPVAKMGPHTMVFARPPYIMDAMVAEAAMIIDAVLFDEDDDDQSARAPEFRIELT
jgi:hypothetical protein